MQRQECERIYRDFVARILASRSAWSVSCCGEIVAVHGGPMMCVPLFPDRVSADYFTTRYWPDLAPISVTLRELTRTHLPFFAEVRVPVGISIAPLPDAIVLSPRRLRRDLLAREGREDLAIVPASDA